MKFIKLFILFFIFTSVTYSQFDKPVLQFGLGLVEPFDDLKGTYYSTTYYSVHNNVIIPLLAPDTGLFASNYGAKTGLYFYGKGKINFDKYNIFRAMASISFSTFNTFQPSQNGNIGVRAFNDSTILPTSVSYNYTFNVFSIGIGLEVAPFAFTNVFSPFFGGTMTFNSMSAKLSRNEGFNDSVTFNASAFRIGFSLDAGIEAKFSKMFGMVLGIKYDLGNVLLKSTSSGIADRHQWGSTNASLNDDQGQYFSDLQSYLDPPSYYGLVNSKKKNINWGTIYLGVNIYFNTEKNKNTPPKK
jgi:hypothetical protein